MATPKAEFEFGVKDGASGPAGEAANALVELREAIDADTKALTTLNRQMRQLKEASLTDTASFKKLKEAIDLKKQSLGQANAKLIEAGGHLEQLGKKIPKKPLEDAKHGIENISDVAGKMSGPVGKLANTWRFAKETLFSTTGVIVGLVAAFALLSVAVIKMTVDLYKYATAQANARRSELLRLEGIGKIRTMYSAMMGVQDQSGKEMQSTIDAVSAKYAVSREQLVQYGAQLHNLNLRGKQWSSALEGMAIKASTQGDAQAQLFAGWASYYNLAGRSVDKLTDKVKSRLGGIAKAQMLDANVQAEKLQESYSMLTSGIDIEPLLKAQKAFNDLFSQSTASGQYLKRVLGQVMQPLVDAAMHGFRVLKILSQETIILALKVELAYLRMRNALNEAWDTHSLKGAVESLKDPLTYLWAALELVYDACLSIMTPLTSMGDGFKLSTEAIEGFVDLLNETDLAETVSHMLDGLVQGIENEGGKFISKMAGLAKDGWAAFKDALGIASPSKAFAQLGKEIPLGIAVGVRSTSGEATAAVKQTGTALAPAMPIPASTPTKAGASAAKSGGAGGVTVNMGGITIHGEGGNAKEIVDALEDRIARMFEAVAIQLGGGTVNAS